MFINKSTRDLARKGRKHEKAIFTKRYHVLQNLIRAEAQGSALKEVYEVLVWAYEVLDKSH